MIGRESVFSQALSKSDSIVSSSEMNKLFEARFFFIDKFLVIWSDDYIRHLPPCTRQGCKRDDLKIEFVVLIQDDTIPSVNKVVNDRVEKHNSDKLVQSSLEGTIDLTDVSPKSWFGRIIKPVKRLDM